MVSQQKSRPRVQLKGLVDVAISTAECFRSLLPNVKRYEAFLVACFSAHPLITALREEVEQSVIGIMEPSLYAARLCGEKVGVITSNVTSKLLHGNSLLEYLPPRYCSGCEASGVSVLEFKSKSRDEVYAKLARAVEVLVKDRDAIVSVSTARE